MITGPVFPVFIRNVSLEISQVFDYTRVQGCRLTSRKHLPKTGFDRDRIGSGEWSLFHLVSF
jgi:hypothetical protein